MSGHFVLLSIFLLAARSLGKSAHLGGASPGEDRSLGSSRRGAGAGAADKRNIETDRRLRPFVLLAGTWDTAQRCLWRDLPAPRLAYFVLLAANSIKDNGYFAEMV